MNAARPRRLDGPTCRWRCTGARGDSRRGDTGRSVGRPNGSCATEWGEETTAAAAVVERTRRRPQYRVRLYGVFVRVRARESVARPPDDRDTTAIKIIYKPRLPTACIIIIFIIIKITLVITAAPGKRRKIQTNNNSNK